MADKNQRLLIITSSLSLVGGTAGVALGSTYKWALGTDPAWAGPAILVAGIGALVVGFLLLPAAIRAYRSGNAA